MDAFLRDKCAERMHTRFVTTIPFDTHRVVTRLKERGFTEEQASGIAEAMRELDLSQLATKADLRELELRMIVKLGTIVVAATTFLTVIKYFG